RSDGRDDSQRLPDHQAEVGAGAMLEDHWDELAAEPERLLGRETERRDGAADLLSRAPDRLPALECDEARPLVRPIYEPASDFPQDSSAFVAREGAQSTSPRLCSLDGLFDIVATGPRDLGHHVTVVGVSHQPHRLTHPPRPRKQEGLQ